MRLLRDNYLICERKLRAHQIINKKFVRIRQNLMKDLLKCFKTKALHFLLEPGLENLSFGH